MPASTITTVSPDEVHGLLQPEAGPLGGAGAPAPGAPAAVVTVLDVRSEAEFAGGSLPGALNVPLDRLRERAPQLGLEGSDVVLVCRTGARARRAAGVLSGSGAADLKVLEGGLEGYAGPATAAPSSGPSCRYGGWSTPATEAGWGMDRQIRLVAGGIVAASIVTSVWKPRARLIAGVIGSGLVFSAVSNFCAMGAALSRLPFNQPRAQRG